MTFLHFRFKNRLGLLASQSLAFEEAEDLKGHVGACEECQQELVALTHLTSMLTADAATERPLPISSNALRTRVLARIHAPETPRLTSPLTSMASALSLVGIGLLAGMLVTRMVHSPHLMDTDTETETETAAQRGFEEHGDATIENAAFYERLEQSRTRANAVRYLTEAQDVLVQVTASASDCSDSPPDSPEGNVDVAREARTSRLLLKRRAALISGSEETLVAARGVLEEVEGVLQQVADLEQCTRRTDVAAIARRVDKKNLLMKIDLMAQELAAP